MLCILLKMRLYTQHNIRRASYGTQGFVHDVIQPFAPQNRTPRPFNLPSVYGRRDGFNLNFFAAKSAIVFSAYTVIIIIMYSYFRSLARTRSRPPPFSTPLPAHGSLATTLDCSFTGNAQPSPTRIPPSHSLPLSLSDEHRPPRRSDVRFQTRKSIHPPSLSPIPRADGKRGIFA